MDVTKTRELNLCVSCEICNAVCPVDAIQMEFKEGQFLPDVDQNECIDCEKCIEVCPGLDITIFNDENFTDKITGPYIEGYSAYTKDQDILKNSTSGGAITQMIIELLKEKEYDGAFVLPFDMFDGNQARLCLAETEEEVRKASKSKYLPASDYNVVKRLESEEEPSYIIVGTPCQLSGIKNFIDLKNINDKGLLYLGLFCDRTLNFNFLDYMEEKYANEGENIVKFEYRNKEKDGWPGDVKAWFDSGREKIIDRQERMRVKKFFQLERCLYCLDKLNCQADISFGDCYIAGKENPGRSSMIVRTEKGKEVWDRYKDSFQWEKSNVESIKKSQGISQKKENLEFAKVLVDDYEIFKKEKNEKPNGESREKLQKRKEKISLGKKRKNKKINKEIKKGKMKDKVEYVKNRSMVELGVGVSYLKDSFQFSSDSKSFEKVENLVLFGGNVFNKGAQAMLFTVVDQMKRRFPIKNVYLLNPKAYKIDQIEKNKYDFKILPWGLGSAINILNDNRITKLNWITCSPEEEKETKDVVEKADLFLDLSGYKLHSATNGQRYPLDLGQQEYLSRIMLAKNYSKPFFILPQSIGPFEYGIINQFLFSTLMKRYLKYPKKIYPREPQGVEALKNFTKSNVERKRDMVLLNGGYDLNNIFSNKFEMRDINIKEDSVGIIPNTRVLNKLREKKFYKVYESIIKKLLNYVENIYILRHSQQDFHICENIKNLFKEEDRVKLLLKDFNTIVLEKIIENFNFIIGSRYHSIINAYKNGVPAVVLGWALKYEELLKDFDQHKYHFDMRNQIEKRQITEKIESMICNYENQSNKIKNRLDELDKNPVFKDIENILK